MLLLNVAVFARPGAGYQLVCKHLSCTWSAGVGAAAGRHCWLLGGLVAGLLGCLPRNTHVRKLVTRRAWSSWLAALKRASAAKCRSNASEQL